MFLVENSARIIRDSNNHISYVYGSNHFKTWNVVI